MLPTLRSGQVIIGLPYKDRLRTGEIVVVRHGGLEKIKRIDRMSDDRLYVVGDNQAHSTDSRSFGWLHQSTIVARVVWPRRKNKRPSS